MPESELVRTQSSLASAGQSHDHLRPPLSRKSAVLRMRLGLMKSTEWAPMGWTVTAWWSLGCGAVQLPIQSIIRRRLPDLRFQFNPRPSPRPPGCFSGDPAASPRQGSGDGRRATTSLAARWALYAMLSDRIQHGRLVGYHFTLEVPARHDHHRKQAATRSCETSISCYGIR
jgi:hypothetical protein